MMKNRKKKILCILAGCTALVILLVGGVYYMLTRYYFYNVHNIPAKKEMMLYLDNKYGGPFELVSAEFELAEGYSEKFQYYVHIWIFTLADDKGQEFQGYLWIKGPWGKGAGSDPLSDVYSYNIDDTYVETGAESLTYDIGQDKEEYKISVCDSQGNLLYESSYSKEPTVKRIGKDTLEIHEGAGNTGWSVFINGETGEVSEPVVDVIACSKRSVVYPVFEDGVFKIVIRDIYDEDVYKEITDDFPPVATGAGFIKEAKVLDESYVYLDYYTGSGSNGDEWEEKKVVVYRWRPAS